jgi:hypothetical protein
MPQNATRPINSRLSQDCVHVPAEVCSKITPSLTPDFLPQQKGPNEKKTLYVNNRELLIF